mmetsp:Transcript_100402/g.255464  ORF Transcript_100402/g.255464 Transcript_100402/m.255464 type:complete len:233 (+) Transcript_100402:96-794(+)|eukprot:CAMPEP_0183538644 /NCGR_PEP_ID=MMETSP0371-20130417/29729_1 /TAXON_ID=268820 /ORGANISM="Peridinium aciculiferum, Strain PAER-2" /LENGTH=232 /DNA_ID=CAMNT_0025739507 /DNA_START=95 /DNA_END=793 /DNA_ORIENTATION=-
MGGPAANCPREAAAPALLAWNGLPHLPLGRHVLALPGPPGRRVLKRGPRAIQHEISLVVQPKSTAVAPEQVVDRQFDRASGRRGLEHHLTRQVPAELGNVLAPLRAESQAALGQHPHVRIQRVVELVIPNKLRTQTLHICFAELRLVHRNARHQRLVFRVGPDPRVEQRLCLFEVQPQAARQLQRRVRKIFSNDHRREPLGQQRFCQVQVLPRQWGAVDVGPVHEHPRVVVI